MGQINQSYFIMEKNVFVPYSTSIDHTYTDRKRRCVMCMYGISIHDPRLEYSSGLV